MSTVPTRWGDLQRQLEKAAYDRLRGRGVGCLQVTLVFVNGELSCWSDPASATYGPYGASEALANFLNKRPVDSTDKT